MAGLSKINKKVLAGVIHAGGVVGAAVGEGFAILHENVKHVGGQTINASKSILKSLESTLDGRAPEENLRPPLPPEVENLQPLLPPEVEPLENLQPLLPPEVELLENLQPLENPSSKPSSQILM